MLTKRRRKAGVPRKSTRVDFTPMVDMNMLLLTFFMFCTTLSKPQTLELAMPVPTEDPGPTIPKSQAITFILAEKNKVYYYEGMPDYENYTSLKEVNYNGVRDVLAKKNSYIIDQVNETKERLITLNIKGEEYASAMKEIRSQKKGAIAIIKPTKESRYENLIDILDEMAICSVARYSIDNMNEADEFLIDNYKTKGMLIEQ